MKTAKGIIVGIVLTLYELVGLIAYILFMATCVMIGLCRANIASHTAP
jgi:hypothetical protein